MVLLIIINFIKIDGKAAGSAAEFNSLASRLYHTQDKEQLMDEDEPETNSIKLSQRQAVRRASTIFKKFEKEASAN